MLHSMGDAGIGLKVRNATEWDEDVTQRVQKLERIEPFFAGGDGFFSTYFPDPIPLTLLLFSRYLTFPSLRRPSHSLYSDYSIDVIEIYVPFKDAMVGNHWGLERI